MIIVKVNKGGIDGALKTFKFKFAKTKVKEQLRDIQEFTKKSVKKRKEKNKAIYKQSKYGDAE